MSSALVTNKDWYSCLKKVFDQDGTFDCKIINLPQTYSVTEFPSSISAKLAETTHLWTERLTENGSK